MLHCKFLNITCTLVATSMVLWSLECILNVSCIIYKHTLVLQESKFEATMLCLVAIAIVYTSSQQAYKSKFTSTNRAKGEVKIQLYVKMTIIYAWYVFEYKFETTSFSFLKFLYVYLSSNWKNGVDKGLLSYAGSILMFLANDNNKYS